jgi:hypothetical protein
MIQFYHKSQGFQSSSLKLQLIDNQLLIKKVETHLEVSTLYESLAKIIAPCADDFERPLSSASSEKTALNFQGLSSKPKLKNIKH